MRLFTCLLGCEKNDHTLVGLSLRNRQYFPGQPLARIQLFDHDVVGAGFEQSASMGVVSRPGDDFKGREEVAQRGDDMGRPFGFADGDDHRLSLIDPCRQNGLVFGRVALEDLEVLRLALQYFSLVLFDHEDRRPLRRKPQGGGSPDPAESANENVAVQPYRRR